MAKPPPADDPARPQVSRALIHFGEARAIGPRLDEHLAFCRKLGVRCLFVSDDIPLACVRSREVGFEFAPWPAQTALLVPGGYPAAVDHTYLRLGRIMRFWQVVGCTWHGDRAEHLQDLAPPWAHPVLLLGRAAEGTASHGPGGVLPSTA